MIARLADAAAWHDVECGSYSADLPIWRELAVRHGPAVLDVGCGTGRVALDIAARGARVAGLDADPSLVAAMAERAAAADAQVSGIVADARSFDTGARYGLVISSMQVVQLLGGPDGRVAMLLACARHLEAAGVLAIAVADPFEAVPADVALPPLPDIREIDGWVLSSLPVAVRDEGGRVVIDRVRQAVSPAGDIEEELSSVALDAVTPATLEAEAAQAGLNPVGRIAVDPTGDHVGSTVCLMGHP